MYHMIPSLTVQGMYFNAINTTTRTTHSTLCPSTGIGIKPCIEMKLKNNDLGATNLPSPSLSPIETQIRLLLWFCFCWENTNDLTNKQNTTLVLFAHVPLTTPITRYLGILPCIVPSCTASQPLCSRIRSFENGMQHTTANWEWRGRNWKLKTKGIFTERERRKEKGETCTCQWYNKQVM